jgi:hypothetical protein
MSNSKKWTFSCEQTYQSFRMFYHPDESHIEPYHKEFKCVPTLHETRTQILKSNQMSRLSKTDRSGCPCLEELRSNKIKTISAIVTADDRGSSGFLVQSRDQVTNDLHHTRRIFRLMAPNSNLEYLTALSRFRSADMQKSVNAATTYSALPAICSWN